MEKAICGNCYYWQKNKDVKGDGLCQFYFGCHFGKDELACNHFYSRTAKRADDIIKKKFWKK